MHQKLAGRGDRPEDVHLVLGGFARRYKVLRNGKHQIMALLLPGDSCDLHVAMDHDVATLSPCTIVHLSRATILDLTENHPRIARALSWATLVDQAILREWLVNVGQREAQQRMAHLFCELLMRLQVAGLASTDGFDFPFRQTALAEVLDLTSVHVNRTLQVLREEGLIIRQEYRLDIPNVERLKAYCDFDPNCLHLVKRHE